MPTQSIYFDDETLEAVREYAKRHDRSVSWAVRDLVRAGLEVVRVPVIRDIRTEYARRVQDAQES